MRIEVSIRVTESESYTTKTVVESSRFVEADADYATIRGTLDDILDGVSGDAHGRLRDLQKAAERAAREAEREA